MHAFIVTFHLYTADDDSVTVVGKSIAATNPLDTISEKSFNKDDNTEVEEETKEYYFVMLEKMNECSEV